MAPKMDGDKRIQEQTRHLMLRYLNEVQRVALNQLEGTGWGLSFVRRPLLGDNIAFIKDANSGRYGILDLDGTLNENHESLTRH